MRKKRRGKESNQPRLLRADNGFEDRGGHQAPITLRKVRETIPLSTARASESSKTAEGKFRAENESPCDSSQFRIQGVLIYSATPRRAPSEQGETIAPRVGQLRDLWGITC